MYFICLLNLFYNKNVFLAIVAESEEEEFFECTSEEPANEDDSSSRAQQKATHLLWNKPAGRLAKHPSLKYKT